MIEYIEGGVTAPKDFLANGVLCKIKANRTTKDVALIYSKTSCFVAGLFTQNRVQAEPVKLCMQKIQTQKAQAIIANSGNANACTGENGKKVASTMCHLAADALKIDEQNVLVASTGVIGQQLDVSKIEEKMTDLVKGLSKQGHTMASQAIITTDTHTKECALTTTIAKKTVTIGAMCKGSGMIHINMGTMLCFVTTDCNISPCMLQKALEFCTTDTFNCVSIDGDTSTNDTLLILANGQAGNDYIEKEDDSYWDFVEALKTLCTIMAKKIAADGEGAGRLLECCVTGAIDMSTARALAKSVVSSSLVKAAFFGKDANWGRILCALGYSGEYFSPEKVTVSFSSLENSNRYFKNSESQNISGIEKGKIAQKARSIMVFQNGVPLDFDEKKAKQVLDSEVVGILIELGDGKSTSYTWGCDLTYDYVKINGDYRT